MLRFLTTVVAAFLMAPGLAKGQVSVVTGEAAGTIIQGGVTGGIVPGQMPTRDNAPPAKPGTATLRGRVLAGDTGQPLRRAQVRISSSGPIAPGQQPQARLTTTDTNGRYELKEVRAGRYSLNVSKPGGYMDMGYGQRRPSDVGKLLEVLDGQTIEHIDFSLPRGGVITGRILDEVGDPVTDVRVEAVRPLMVFGVRRLVPAGRTATTNDIGEFRLFALAPGDYFLSATLRSNDLSSFAETDNRTGYAPTYYPGTSDIGSAQRFTVAMGQTISDLSLPLIPARTARVTGVALDSQDRPMRGFVSVTARFGFFDFSGSQLRPDGSFTINGLPPGDYTLQVQTQGAPGTQEYASADITVNGADLSGVRLEVVNPSVIAGRIVIRSGDQTSLRRSTLRISATSMTNGGMVPGPPSPPGPVNDDWTFQTKARPGQARIVVTGLAAPWMVKAVRHRGSDVTDTGLAVGAGEDLSDIEVELTNKVTTLSGLITNNRGEPMAEYWVVLFARDPARRRPPTRYVRTARADQSGRFKTAGLPPGEYLAFALEAVNSNGEETDPDFLDRLDTRATRFALSEGETKTLDLKLSALP